MSKHFHTYQTCVLVKRSNEPGVTIEENHQQDMTSTTKSRCLVWFPVLIPYLNRGHKCMGPNFVDRFIDRENGTTPPWMDEILHHLETMENHCSFAY